MDGYNPYEAPASDLSLTPTGTSEEGYTSTMLQSLKETKPWVRFLSVLGFISTGLMVLAGLVTIVAGSFAPSMGAGLGALLGLAYLVMAAIYIVPLVHLHRYANAIGRAALGAGTEAVEEALSRQKSFWRTVGIITLVILGLYVIAIIIAFIGGVVAALATGG